MTASDVVNSDINQSCCAYMITDNAPKTVTETIKQSMVVCWARDTSTGNVAPSRIDKAIPKLYGPMNVIIMICAGMVWTDNGTIPNVPINKARASQYIHSDMASTPPAPSAYTSHILYPEYIYKYHTTRNDV